MSFFEPKTHKNQGLPAYKQSGSVMIWIFVMIALFAALGYAMSQGTRSGVTSISDQQADLAATEILQYASQVKDAVRQLQINGCDIRKISFKDTLNYTTENPNSPADGSCHVSHPNGGGIEVSGTNIRLYNFFINRITGVGTTDADIFIYNRDIESKTCASLNKYIGNDFDINNLPKADISSHVFIGDLNGAVFEFGNAPTNLQMEKQEAGCIIDTGCGAGGECLIFYKVLIAR